MHTTLVDYILEIVQNAVESGADTIELRVTENGDRLGFAVTDNGCGMTAEQLSRCRHPYSSDPRKHPDRAVGLGLAFLAQLTEITDGRLTLDSTPGQGTRVMAEFDKRHIDTPPTGPLDALFIAALSFDGDYDLLIDRRRADTGYTLSRQDARTALGDLQTVEALSTLQAFFRDKESALPPAT